jgi:N-acetylglucosamine-6-phosphate deacetylase
MTTLYINACIFTGEAFIENGQVLVQDGRITDVSSETRNIKHETRLIDLKGALLAPGLIDLQVYGGGGALFSTNPTLFTLENIAAHCQKNGTVGFLATMPTNSPAQMEAAIEAGLAFRDKYPDVLFGLHLEGPFISVAKRGAHPQEHIQAPNAENVAYWLQRGQGIVRIMTLAPEVCSPDVRALAAQYGVVFSAGHSNATYAEATEALNNGFAVATHFFNAMSAFGSREPGVVGAVFDHPTACTSIIADGVHVDFASVRIAKRLLGERLWLITDAVDDSGSDIYRFYKKDNYFVNEAGILSGSALTMPQAVHNCVQHHICDLAEALRMASLYPARVLGVDHEYGRIATGYRAAFFIENKFNA